jgi:hypothetical protein
MKLGYHYIFNADEERDADPGQCAWKEDNADEERDADPGQCAWKEDNADEERGADQKEAEVGRIGAEFGTKESVVQVLYGVFFSFKCSFQAPLVTPPSLISIFCDDSKEKKT